MATGTMPALIAPRKSATQSALSSIAMPIRSSRRMSIERSTLAARSTRSASSAQLGDALLARREDVRHREKRKAAEEEHNRIPMGRNQHTEHEKNDARGCEALRDGDSPGRRAVRRGRGSLFSYAQDAPAEHHAEQPERSEDAQHHEVAGLHC